MLEGLQGEGEALPLVLWAMSEEIRTLIKLQSGLADGKPLAAVLKENRVWGPRERLADAALRRLPLPLLKEALREAAQIDRLVKGLKPRGFSGDAWDALLQLGLKIAQGAR
jgi:DNA polymerase-3 subunit delta